jgi:hypothetical protein
MQSYITHYLAVSPHSWVSAEQEAYILEHYSNFMQCQAKQDYTTFWPPFFQGWFAKFPERMVVFPDIPINVKLSNDQKETVGAEIKAQQDVGVLVNDGGVAELTGLQQLWNKL